MSYQYAHVTVERVIDGDTVAMAVDMGNKVTWRENFRLMGIDTPEHGQAGAAEATAYLAQLLSAGVERIETFKPDKYGRWLADLFVAASSGGELHVNKMMVVEGFAREYFGGKK
jgi:endonuclease YncB( thermonuclease family)